MAWIAAASIDCSSRCLRRSRSRASSCAAASWVSCESSKYTETNGPVASTSPRKRSRVHGCPPVDRVSNSALKLVGRPQRTSRGYLLAASPDMTTAASGQPVNPWQALWAMLVGFFMILVDSTIVAVANPSIMAALDITDYDVIVWVTSAYLLAYAVPLLLSGRLGDRFGPKNLYIAGLVVFTAASLWCGLSRSVGMLIAARVLQGVGAALLTPQTLSMITRIFRRSGAVWR